MRARTWTETHARPISLRMTHTPENAAPGKTLSPAAIRALEEAEARRKAEAEAAGKDATT